MRRAGVRNVVFAAFPNFMKEKSAGMIGTAVQVILEAALFFACGSDEGAEFRFEEQVLAFFGAKGDDECEGTFRKFGEFGAAGFTGTARR